MNGIHFTVFPNETETFRIFESDEGLPFPLNLDRSSLRIMTAIFVFTLIAGLKLRNF
jgi:hypothetical protein